MLIRSSSTAILFATLAFARLIAGETPPAKPADAAQVEADKKALAPILQYVGGWRGVGQPRDGGKEGWLEDSEWLFDLKGGHAALVFNSEKGKYYKLGRIEPGAKKGTFKFVGTLPDGKTKEELSGEINKENDLVFNTAAAPADGRPARLVFSVVAKGDRLLLNYQKKMAGERYSNISEVGYTRKGSNFGKQADAHECIITGGKGTISVAYKGQSYWVCCTGCRDAFLENPEKELAAYKKRKEDEKKKDMQ